MTGTDDERKSKESTLSVRLDDDYNDKEAEEEKEKYITIDVFGK